MIDKIILRNFRAAAGSFELAFERHKNLALIFGENGTGKTTIADALECLGSETAGSLSEKSGTKPKEHLATIGKLAADFSIEAHANQTNTSPAQKWVLKFGKKDLVCSPQPKPKIKVLRRLHIQKISDAAPGERYDRLKEFLDFPNVVRAEEALAEAFKNTKAAFDNASKMLVTVEDQLTTSWQANGSPKGTLDNWLSSRRDTNALNTNDRAGHAKRLSASIQTLEANFDPIGIAAESVKSAQRVCDIDKQSAELTADTKSNAQLVELLRSVSDFLAMHKAHTECPVCEQAIDFDLQSKVNKRLDGMAKEEAKAKQVTANLKTHDNAKAGYESRVSAFIRLSKSLLVELQKNELKLDISLLSKSVIDNLSAAKGVLDFALEAKKTIDAIVEGAQAEQILGPKVVQLQESRTETKQLEQVVQRIDQALKLFRATRIRSTQAVLNSIIVECNRLYACIHPNELTAISRLELDPNRRASLNQSVNFEGHTDVPPQAYLSESHLDTLAFCFWLAAAKLDDEHCDSTLVLDDVFSTVDEQHTERIARLLIDESEVFSQVIVLTHQRAWQRHLKKSSHVQALELTAWSLEKGISMFNSVPPTDRLERLLAERPVDRQAVSSGTGVLLEAVLDKLVVQYRCSMSRTHAKYTLQELLNACAKLMKDFRIERDNGTGFAEVDVSISWKRIGELAHIRNEVGAHHNANGDSVSTASIIEFGQSALDFVRAVTCDKCRLIVTKESNGYYECNCKTHRMYPLKLK